jgi:hypothetical protein
MSKQSDREKRSLQGDRGDGGYEPSYFAFRHGLSMEQARKIIDRVGFDRGRLDRAAMALKKRLLPEG